VRGVVTPSSSCGSRGACRAGRSRRNP
jgi:hypothetical protein